MLPPSFQERFVQTFTPEPFRQLAKQTGWFKRQGKIDPFDFVTSQIFGQLSASRQTLAAQIQGLSEPVSRQAVDQRFTPEAVNYLQAVFAHVLAQTLDWSPTHPQAGLLRTHFKALYLLDCTSFDCPNSLKDLFPSCGGAGSAANVKVLLRYDFISGRLEPLQLLAGKRSDQGQAREAAERLQAGELQLQDKGFYSAEAWQAAQQRGAFLLMPLPHQVTLWLSPDPKQPAEEAIDLAGALRVSTQNEVEWPQLFLGTPRHRTGAVRLVAFRLSKESAERQRQGMRESTRKQGRTPTAKALELAGWLLLVTNAPIERLPSAMMSYVYRLRWQVELIFRQIKTTLRLDQSESENPCRVQCEIWARLTCAVLHFLWHAHASAQCWQRHGCEASLEKTVRLLQHWGHSLGRALLGEPAALLTHVRLIWRHLLAIGAKGKQKTRRGSWEKLFELWLNVPVPAAPLSA